MNRLYSFPVANKVHYFDYAATALIPDCVLSAWVDYQNTIAVDGSRNRSRLSQEANKVKETSIETLRSFFSLGQDTVWQFGKNVTEVINLVALGLTNVIQPMDYIVVGPFEHHSNYLPWRYLAKRTGAVFMELPVDSRGIVDLSYVKLISKHIKVFSYSSVSNTTGYIFDASSVLELLPCDTIVFCDLSQEAGHKKIQLPERVDCKFLPSHKMYGPKGIAAAAFPERLTRFIQPVLLGGGMVKHVGMDDSWAEGSTRYAAGTADVGLLYAWATAARFLTQIGMKNIEAFELKRYSSILERMKACKSIKLFIPPTPANSIIAFIMNGVHCHDLEYMLAKRDIVIRTGHLCSQNSIRRLGLDAICRVSLGLGISDDDITVLCDALEDFCV